jgi:hypothetical protein
MPRLTPSFSYIASGSSHRLFPLALFVSASLYGFQAFSVKSYGAAGNGVVAADCSITSGSDNLTCPVGQFSPASVGSVIAVYEAGAKIHGFVQPLSTRITAFIDARNVLLSSSAINTASPASRTVWGTDDTKSLQQALDSIASAAGSGGELYFPPGIYLTRGLKLPCSTIGTFAGGVCTKSYNNIWLHGAGQDATTLENWDVATSYATSPGLVWLGGSSETPFLESTNNRLSNIIISDLTLHQVTHSTESLKIITSKATDNVEIRNTHITGGSYEGIVMSGAGRGQRWLVHDNFADNVGLGGPAYSSYLAAWNLTGEQWTAENNFATNVGQCAEIGTNRVVLRNNVCTSSPPNSVAVNIGSNGAGAYDIEVSNNFIFQFGNCIVAANGLGPLNRLYIQSNICIDAGSIHVQSGQETVIYNDGQLLDTTIHGRSFLDRNIQIFSAPLVSPAIGIGAYNTSQSGLEGISITNHRIYFTHAYCQGETGPRRICSLDSDCGSHMCRLMSHVLVVSGFQGGGDRWKPALKYKQGDVVVPDVSNGFYYRCIAAGTSREVEPVWPTEAGSSVTDGEILWVNKGISPTVTVSNMRVSGPFGIRTIGEEFKLEQTRRENVRVDFVMSNFPWTVKANNYEQAETFEELVPANQFYGDADRVADAMPLAGRYDLGTQIHRLNPNARDRGWLVTRAGYAAPVWKQNTAYAFGTYVTPVDDNGYFYMQIVGSGCASSRAEPDWPKTSGDPVNDGTCTWKLGGQAVRFGSLPNE